MAGPLSWLQQSGAVWQPIGASSPPRECGDNPFEDSEAEYEGLTSLYPERRIHQSGHGTSVAAPLVAGAIAALKSMFPNLSYHQIRDRILETADESVYDFYPNAPGLLEKS